MLFATDDGYITARRWAHGEVVWHVKIGSSTESSPLVIGTRFYVGDLDGRVHCLSVATGKHVWAERYDRQMAEVFVVQDELVDRVVGSVTSHPRTTRHSGDDSPSIAS